MESKLRDGYKMTELGALPEEWDVVKLGQISQTITKGTTPTTYGYNYVENGIPFLRVENITENANINLNDVKYISCKTHDFLNRSKLEEGDILFSIAGAIGRCALVTSEIVPANINQAVSLIRFKSKTQLNPDFILQMLSSNKIKKQTELEATSLAQTNLNLEQVKNISIPFPSFTEQHRIATILSTLDETVEHTEALIEKYKNIKAGLMADLLTRGIDEEGRIRSEGTHRFKDSALGRVPEEWEISTLGDVCAKAINGGTPSTDVENYWTGAIPWITGADILTQTVSKIRRYITEEAVKDSSTNVIPKGNLLIVTRTGVGKLAIAPFDIAVSQDFTGVIPNDNTTTEYLFWLLNKSVNYFLNLTQGTSINGITRNDLMSFVFPLPPLQEQRRIAEILTAADQRIEKEEAYRDKLLQLKKGLMQDLLTGKVRVKDGSAQMAEQSEN